MKKNNNQRPKKIRPNTSFKAVSKSAKGKHRTQNQAGAKKHFSAKNAEKRSAQGTRTGASTSHANQRGNNRDSQRTSQRDSQHGSQHHQNQRQDDVTQYGVRFVTVEENADGQRIDNYLRRLMPSVPKSHWYKTLRKGNVRINKKRAKAETRIYHGDIVRIPPITLEEKTGIFVPEHAIAEIKNAILHEDEHFLIINKPAGIAVHAGTKNHYGVIDVVRQAFPDAGWELCHRLDKDTSGCLVLGRNRVALNTFQQLSMSGEIHKQYLTLVKGSWIANERLITTPIEKQAVSRMTGDGTFEKVVEGGDVPTHTTFTTRENYAKTTLMQAVIKTGKTHQIRVHAAQNKHPVAMDDKYGDFKWNRALEKLGLSRIFLHAHWIRFKAFGEIIHVSAELPSDLQDFLDNHC